MDSKTYRKVKRSLICCPVMPLRIPLACSRFTRTWDRKDYHMLRALSLMMVPLLALTALACYWLVINVIDSQLLEEEKSEIIRSQTIAGVAYALQLERASVVYALQENNASMLPERFQFSDEAIRGMKAETSCLRGREEFLRQLSNHRHLVVTNLDSNRTNDEVNYYSEITNCILEDLMGLAKNMQHGKLWQDYVSYKLMLQATESAGILLALGIAFFERGSLPMSEYTALRKYDVSVQEHLVIVARFSPFTRDKLELLQTRRPDVFSNIEDFRRHWLVNDYAQAGPEKGNEFQEAVIRYFNLLVELKDQVAQKVVNDAEKEISVALNMVIIACFVFIFVLVMTPVLIKMMHTLTTSIQNYATEASQKSEQLIVEKARSDSLLYQMLPKSVAQQLKMNQTVAAECYDQVTVCFSDIVGFTKIAAASTPLQVVVLLNSLYQVFDETIDSYDVYKVETIGDAYMVVSGLPHRNGSMHVVEISLMALELVRATQQFVIPHMPDRPMLLRLGCHSGSAVAGVVGTKMPRYCLFGDTVNTASRMESHGLPNRIHISSETNQLIHGAGGFSTETRGVVDIKGKGPMETFFLLSTIRPFRTANRSSLPPILSQERRNVILDASDLHSIDKVSPKSPKQIAWSGESRGV